MEKVKASGKAKSIGVSNYRLKEMEAVLKTAKVVPAVNQLEVHPYLQREDLRALLKKHDIAVEGYGPVMAYRNKKPGPADNAVDSAAAKHGLTDNQVVLKWLIDSDVVALVKSGNEDRLKEYLEAGKTSVRLEESEIDAISASGKDSQYRRYQAELFKPGDIE
jgi:diketogulonate reductase-like aldo/keto reductase